MSNDGAGDRTGSPPSARRSSCTSCDGSSDNFTTATHGEHSADSADCRFIRVEGYVFATP